MSNIIEFGESQGIGDVTIYTDDLWRGRERECLRLPELDRRGYLAIVYMDGDEPVMTRTDEDHLHIVRRAADARLAFWSVPPARIGRCDTEPRRLIDSRLVGFAVTAADDDLELMGYRDPEKAKEAATLIIGRTYFIRPEKASDIAPYFELGRGALLRAVRDAVYLADPWLHIQRLEPREIKTKHRARIIDSIDQLIDIDTADDESCVNHVPCVLSVRPAISREKLAQMKIKLKKEGVTVSHFLRETVKAYIDGRLVIEPR